MGKIIQVGLVCIGVGILYLFMMVIMPVMTDLASTANTTMGVSSNVSNYPGAQEGVLAAPYFLWFVPGGLGMVSVIFILLKP